MDTLSSYGIDCFVANLCDTPRLPSLMGLGGIIMSMCLIEVKMRNLMFIFGAILFQLLLTSLVYADGNSLLKDCLRTERFIETDKLEYSYSVGACFGLVEGVRLTMTLLDSGLSEKYKICLPKNGISNGQAVRVVVAYLKNHPSLLHHGDTALTINAYRDAYPCN